MGTSRHILVLIIEKDENSASEIRSWASLNPVVPVYVSTAVDALLWLGKGNLPDLIIAEAGMEPLNGPDFVRTLKASGFFQDIPLLVFGYPEQHPLMAEMRQAGAVDHIFLPVKEEDLSRRISLYISTEVGV